MKGSRRELASQSVRPVSYSVLYVTTYVNVGNATGQTEEEEEEEEEEEKKKKEDKKRRRRRRRRRKSRDRETVRIAFGALAPWRCTSAQKTRASSTCTAALWIATVRGQSRQG